MEGGYALKLGDYADCLIADCDQCDGITLIESSKNQTENTTEQKVLAFPRAEQSYGNS